MYMDYYGGQSSSLSATNPSSGYGGGYSSGLGGGLGGYNMSGMGTNTGASQAGGPSKMTIIAVVVAILICCSISVYIYMTRSSDDDTSKQAAPAAAAAASGGGGGGQSGSGGGGGASSARSGEERVPDRGDDVKYATFAFEHLTRAYHVPTLEGRIVRKPPANPPYKLVPCTGEGLYAVRWQGKFLTVDREKVVVMWTDEKSEPQSCWRVVPGYCGDDEFVLLRSAANNMVLRPDGASGQLVVKDIPTARTAKDFCWKLVGRAPGQAASTDCGCQYDYEKARVVCIPCGNAATPAPKPDGKGPFTRAPTSAPPPANIDAAARQLIGHDARSAVRYLQQAAPGSTVIAIPRTDIRRQEYAALKFPESLAVVYEPASMKTLSIGVSKTLFAPSGQIAL